VSRDVANGNLSIGAVLTGTPNAFVGIRPWERVTSPAPFGSQATQQREMYWWFQPKLRDLLGGPTTGDEYYGMLVAMMTRYKYYRIKKMACVFRPNAARPYIDVQTMTASDQDVVRGPEAWFMITGRAGPIIPALPVDAVTNWSYDEANTMSATGQYRLAKGSKLGKRMIHISDMNKRRKPVFLSWVPREYVPDLQGEIPDYSAAASIQGFFNGSRKQESGAVADVDTFLRGPFVTRKPRWHQTAFTLKDTTTGVSSVRPGVRGQVTGISGCFGLDTWLADSYIPWTMQHYVTFEFKGPVDVLGDNAAFTYPTWQPQMANANDFAPYGATVRPNPY